MRLLLDTQIFIWLMNGDPRLSKSVLSRISHAEHVAISAATIWEIAIKVRLGKLQLDVDEAIAEIGANGFEELAVLSSHARLVAKLPLLHGDPIDRLLVAQAQAEQMRLLTADPQLEPYTDLVVLV